jgi:hypothetical protein
MQWCSCGEDNHLPTENISSLLWSLKIHYCLHMGTLQKKDERKYLKKMLFSGNLCTREVVLEAITAQP